MSDRFQLPLLVPIHQDHHTWLRRQARRTSRLATSASTALPMPSRSRKSNGHTVLRHIWLRPQLWLPIISKDGSTLLPSQLIESPQMDASIPSGHNQYVYRNVRSILRRVRQRSGVPRFFSLVDWSMGTTSSSLRELRRTDQGLRTHVVGLVDAFSVETVLQRV